MNTSKEPTISEQIAALELEIKARGGILGPGHPKLSPERRLEFLQRVLDFERAHERPEEWSIDLEKEVRTRIRVPEDPDCLTDGEVFRFLREMIELLARFHLILTNTDHLDDRELYQVILNRVLKEPLIIGPQIIGGHVYQEICPCDAEEYMQYFASEAEREEWESDWGETLPPAKPLKANRDKDLMELAERYRWEPLPDFKAV